MNKTEDAFLMVKALRRHPEARRNQCFVVENEGGGGYLSVPKLLYIDECSGRGAGQVWLIFIWVIRKKVEQSNQVSACQSYTCSKFRSVSLVSALGTSTNSETFDPKESRLGSFQSRLKEITCAFHQSSWTKLRVKRQSGK